MATSRYSLPGAFHSHVYRDNATGKHFILIPDIVRLFDPGREQTQVYEVVHEPGSSSNETYQVFRKGCRREDLETGQRIVGTLWGTHTVLEAGATLSQEEVSRFRTQFTGTGCMIVVVGVSLLVLGFMGASVRLIL